MTDIHLPAASAHLAEAATRQIFGADVGLGPVCSAPEYLLKVKESAEWRVGEIARIPLEWPPAHHFPLYNGNPPAPHLTLVCDKCNVICGGKLIGTTLRMDAENHAVLRACAEAWRHWNLRLARSH